MRESVKVTFPRRAPTPPVLIALIVASADAAPASRVAPKRKPVTNKPQSAINL